MQQESTQRDLATKLVMLKNQILENDASKHLGRRFGACRITDLGVVKTFTPVSLEFSRVTPREYLLSIESRQKLVRIECESIEAVAETKDGRLAISYFAQKKEGFQKKTELFECFEIGDIVKVFQSIRTIVESAINAEEGQGAARGVSKSFVGTQMFMKSQSTSQLSPIKTKKKSFLLL
jgi:hypothetical protein